MKKKKPKVSPAKSSPKSSPPVKSLTPKSDDKDLLRSSPVFVSDAQIGPVADEVAQQAGGSADLVPCTVLTFSDKTEIVDASTDPSSVLDEVLPLMPESSSMVPPSCSSASDPTEEICSVKAATSAALLIATADANNVRLSQQLADEITVAKVSGPVELEGSKVTLAEDVPSKGSDAVAGVAKPVSEAAQKEPVTTVPPAMTDWCAHAKGLGKRLSKKGEAFTLPSGEACIQIPNSVIEKNRKSWEPFVLGQFYSEPPSQGTLHNIVNGI